MDTSQLLAFIAVAESGSFTHAAANLHLTQPAISKRIASLENTLEAKLFDRIGKRVLLTEAGRILLQQARKIMLEINTTRTRITNLSAKVSGRLTLASSHHIGLHRLPPVLKEYARVYPEVSIDISFLDSEQAYEQVRHGEIELAVVTLAPAAIERIQNKMLWNDQLFIMCSQEHALAHNSNLRLQDLLHHPVILPAENTFTRQVVEDLFKSRKYNLEIEMSTNYLETIKMMVSIGMAWSVLPLTMLDDSLKILSIKDVNLNRKLGYIYHQHHTLSNAACAFINLLEAYAD
jgi:DNA-binding transcriptional LysR family regulator